MGRNRGRDGLSGSRSGVANPKKIILAGRSWGGYLTPLGLTLQPERWGYVERVRVPVLIIAGEHDPRCPIRQIENYVARLRELGKPHEVYRYDAGHGSLVVDETIRQVEAQIAFAARHLATTPPR